GRSGRPESAHDELRAARFDDSPADIVIAALQRVGDALNREAVGPQTAGVDIDLILPDEPADRRDLGDAGDALQRVPEVPVLNRAEVREAVRAGAIGE